MNDWLVVAGIVLAAVSGVFGLFASRRGGGGERLAAALMVLGAACGIGGSGWALARGSSGIRLPWTVPNGAFFVQVDGLSAMFLIQVFLLGAVGSIYGLGYWPQAEHPRDGRKLRLFYGLMVAGMALLVCARNTILFLAGWEVMALAAFLTLSSQDELEPVRDVSYVYLVATRLGTLCLFAMFALLAAASGGFEFSPLHAGTSTAVQTAIFLLALVGFGLKAGVMPLHIWLPGAHARAPSHVSAVMSGVLIKTGIYGLVRLCSLFPNPPAWWGWVVLGLGSISGVLGVAFAIGQHDLKRLLAYHSVENIGIIMIGLGVALLGRATGHGELVVLGLSGALLHVWNHGLFKGLLFLSAGSVLHATHTREIDQLGGLSRRMPWTSLAFLLGAVAICGLPPLNGFVSELMIYLGLFRSAALRDGHEMWLAGALGAPVLALIGALAAACFVKAFGAVFLGETRSDRSVNSHESSRWMLGPMAVLAACCLLIGLAPPLVAPVLQAAVGNWAPELVQARQPLGSLAPLNWMAIASLGLAASLLAGFLLLRVRLRRPPTTAAVGTWDCGYAAPSHTMQYTSSSFAQTLVGLLGWALRPQVHTPQMGALWPGPATFHSHVPEVVLERILVPASQLALKLTRRFRWLQQGSANAYLLFILLTLFVLLLWRH
ncbi:MAG TPA: proton-conducting transporter membrane subunit [Myxococcales bacterium]